MLTAEDARGRHIRLQQWPQRIVSLVPSVTESVATLTEATRLVGVTKFCREPAGVVAAIHKVGGTKTPDIEAIVALQPDLVLANREENRPEDVAALEAAGLTVFVGYPRTVADAITELETLAGLLQAGDRLRLKLQPVRAELARQQTLNAQRPPVRVLCLIWRNPYMAVGGDTYAGDVLRLAGGENVYETPPSGARYPQLGLADIRDADPEVILLPDEPYLFRERHRRELLALRAIRAATNDHIALLDGRWLTWYGPRIPEGLAGLETILDSARPYWKPPPRPPDTDRETRTDPRLRARQGPPSAASAKRARSKRTPRPQHTPQTAPAMPPGLRLHVPSQEEVVEE